MENSISTTTSSLSRALINLYGVAEIGKTATLTALYDLIKEGLKVSSSYNQIQFRQINQYDFYVIFDYKCKRVGIITMGDPGCEGEVQGFLNECLAHSCDRIFTASRTRGEIFGMVIDFANTNDYTFIETSPLYMRFPNGYAGNLDFLHDSFAQLLETLI